MEPDEGIDNVCRLEFLPEDAVIMGWSASIGGLRNERERELCLKHNKCGGNLRPSGCENCGSNEFKLIGENIVKCVGCVKVVRNAKIVD